MLQEGSNQQFYQGTLQGETSEESQQFPSHSLTQKLSMDGLSLSSSSLKLPCRNPKCRRMTHFPGSSLPPHFQQHSAHGLHNSCSSKWLCRKFLSPDGWNIKRSSPCCPMIWAITPKTSRSFVQLLPTVSPTKANTRTTRKKLKKN